MRAFATAMALLGCATPRVIAPPNPPRPARPLCAEPLQQLAASLMGASAAARARTRDLGVELADARGATGITGDPEADDAVVGAETLTRVDDLGALLVTTRCGNASIVAVRCEGTWRPAGRAALVEGATPGARRITAARAEAVAVFERAPRELLAAWSSERDDGDSERATTFTAYRLAPDGALTDLTGPVAFGGEDDASGAGLVGRWYVDDVLPPPRDVVLELRPSHPGVDGVSLALIERQVWRPTRRGLQRVTRETEAVVPRRDPAGEGVAPPR
ncbi:MAG: hypothetical protein U0325_08965 [Polyangiales bacterium]